MGGHSHNPGIPGVEAGPTEPNTKKGKRKNRSNRATPETSFSDDPTTPDGGDACAGVGCDNPYCGEDDGWGVMLCPCCTKDPQAEFKTLQNMATKMVEYEKKKEDKKLVLEAGIPEATLEGAHPGFKELSEEEKKKEETDKLMHMSYKTALAIALHNFPEGLATFVAALADPAVGALLAVAIAIHNVPEGLCVSLPLYYATGNRRKAFLWGSLSGLTEPLAALLGWAVLANSFSHELYATMFGVVAGMMVLITLRELLPTAHRYDPEDEVVTFAVVAGFGVMALSLGLFLL